MIKKLLSTLITLSASQLVWADEPPEFCEPPPVIQGLTCDLPSRAKSCPGAKVFCKVANAMAAVELDCINYGNGFTRCYASPHSNYGLFTYNWTITRLHTNENPGGLLFSGQHIDSFDLYCAMDESYTVDVTVTDYLGRTANTFSYATCGTAQIF